MKYDYSALCGCGWERYSKSLTKIKAWAKNHIKEGDCFKSVKEVFINRHFIESDIDDTFKELKITN